MSICEQNDCEEFVKYGGVQRVFGVPLQLEEINVLFPRTDIACYRWVWCSFVHSGLPDESALLKLGFSHVFEIQQIRNCKEIRVKILRCLGEMGKGSGKKS